LNTEKWLIHIANAVLDGCEDDREGIPDPIGFIDTQSAVNGFDSGLEPDLLSHDLCETLRVQSSEFQIVNELMHGMRLASQFLTGCPHHEAGFEILACLAYSMGQVEIGDGLLGSRRCVVHGLPHGDPDLLISRLGDMCLATNCDLSARLTTHPILILRSRNGYVAMGRIALVIDESRRNSQSVPTRKEVYAILGDGENRLRRAVSASAALASTDGIIDDIERCLLDSLIGLARFVGSEADILRSELEAPMSVEDLLEPKAPLAERKCLYRLLYLGAYINGEHHHSEQEFIKDLGIAFGDDMDILTECESMALANFEANFGHTQVLAPEGLLALIKHRLARRFETVLQRTGTHLVQEVSETKELMALLAKSTVSPLTEDESTRVRAQLLDLLRGIPALAIFAVPGGAFLLPLVVKFLWVELRPSSFIDPVQLGGENHPIISLSDDDDR
jgi:hypothetical protein